MTPTQLAGIGVKAYEKFSLSFSPRASLPARGLRASAANSADLAAAKQRALLRFECEFAFAVFAFADVGDQLDGDLGQG